MKFYSSGSYWMAALMLCSLTAASAQTIFNVGEGAAKPGEPVKVPVELSAQTDCTSALVRIEYDAVVLESPLALIGDLVGSDHVLDVYSPEAGRLNIAIYSPSGTEPFAAQTGILFNLVFDIKADAQPGTVPISVANTGSPDLPSMDLTAVDGSTLSPTSTPGSVTVLAKNSTRAYWLLYP